MSYRFHRGERLGAGTRRIAGEVLDDALARLDALVAGEVRDRDDVEQDVHEIRKRTKELRGLLRLVGPALGDDARTVRRTVAAAARELASLRDAHAVLGTIDDLVSVEAAATPRSDAVRDGDVQGALDRVRAGQAAYVDATAADDAAHQLRAARDSLAEIRRGVAEWKVPDRFSSIEGGLHRTYRAGRRALATASTHPDDDTVHEWRTSAKALWYEVRLLERLAPSVLEPLADALDDLGDALGDDHDLAVLVHAMSDEPERYGGTATTAVAIDAVRRQQAELRRRAFRLGARIYAERPGAFVRRMEAYWEADRDIGAELRTGGLDVLSPERRQHAQTSAPVSASTVERERKFLVAEHPAVAADGGDHLRQGYLALDGDVAVRIRRSSSGAVVTIKGGSGPARTEVELPLADDQFDALWELTGGRRVEKVRHRIPLSGGGHDGDARDGDVGRLVAELDVFAGALAGLVIVEVEFPDDDAMQSFEPPHWFGAEVTDDRRYANAALAVDGLPT